MSRYLLSHVDAHVGGEPLRLILKGPQLKGKTVLEKRAYMMQHYDFIRTAVVLEPRGHDDMYGAVLTEPSDPAADLGVIFIDGAFYNNMCGHGAIAIATIAVEMGLVPVREPLTRVVLETGAGLVAVEVEVKSGCAQDALLLGTPSFLYRPDVKISARGSEIRADIVYGGNYFAMVDLNELGLKHSKEYLREFIWYGLKIREEINSAVAVEHPENKHINYVEDILFVSEPDFKGDTYKSLVVLGHGQVDRSPCGTGTCARMAALYSRGLLGKREPFYHESITGAVFEGLILDELKVGDYRAVLPQVKGRAFITAVGTLIIDPVDTLRHGFSLR